MSLTEILWHALWYLWWLYDKKLNKLKKKKVDKDYKKKQKCSRVAVNSEGNKGRMEKTLSF